jgi:hypothetical protein
MARGRVCRDGRGVFERAGNATAAPCTGPCDRRRPTALDRPPATPADPDCRPARSARRRPPERERRPQRLGGSRRSVRRKPRPGPVRPGATGRRPRERSGQGGGLVRRARCRRRAELRAHPHARATARGHEGDQPRLQRTTRDVISVGARSRDHRPDRRPRNAAGPVRAGKPAERSALEFGAGDGGRVARLRRRAVTARTTGPAADGAGDCRGPRDRWPRGGSDRGGTTAARGPARRAASDATARPAAPAASARGTTRAARGRAATRPETGARAATRATTAPGARTAATGTATTAARAGSRGPTTTAADPGSDTGAAAAGDPGALIPAGYRATTAPRRGSSRCRRSCTSRSRRGACARTPERRWHRPRAAARAA